MNKVIILTFDYEVFLGLNTGSIENSVIKPTNQILKNLKKYNAKAIFFVDTTWLIFLQSNFPHAFKAVVEQLKEIINIGSSVELHLHPQWLSASKLGDEIFFKSYEGFSLHTLCHEDIQDLFRKSVDLLESITLQKVRCFRAGGFCIEPFTQIKSAFEKCNIKYDFSVVPGIHLTGGNVYDFDFTSAPNYPYYTFENNVNIPELGGQFVEIPLSIYNNNPFYRGFNALLLRLKKDKIFGDGQGIQETSNFFLRSLPRRLKFSKSYLTLDKTSNLFFKYLLRYHFRKELFMVIISHPKTLSGQSLLNLFDIAQKYKTLNSLDLDQINFR